MRITVEFIAAVTPDFDGERAFVFSIAVNFWEIATGIEMGKLANPGKALIFCGKGQPAQWGIFIKRNTFGENTQFQGIFIFPSRVVPQKSISNRVAIFVVHRTDCRGFRVHHAGVEQQGKIHG